MVCHMECNEGPPSTFLVKKIPAKSSLIPCRKSRYFIRKKDEIEVDFAGIIFYIPDAPRYIPDELKHG
jgi:hypothetical protein